MDRLEEERRPAGHARRAWLTAVLAVSIVACAAGDAPTSEPAQQVITEGPVEYRLIVRQSPPQKIHVVTVDLTDPRVSLHLCRGGADPDGDGVWETTLATVKDIAVRNKLVAAVNGSMFTGKDKMTIGDIHDPYFTGNWSRSLGWTVSDGKVWATHPLSPEAPSLVVIGDRTVQFGNFDKPPAEARQMVSGVQFIVRAGKNVAGKDARIDPRTAVGTARNGQELVMLVVDGGRRDEAVGFTLAQMADELIQLGCQDGLILDGGGSSTIVFRGTRSNWEVMNHPSDGHDLIVPLSVTRPVANALGVVVGDVPDTQPVDPP